MKLSSVGMPVYSHSIKSSNQNKVLKQNVVSKTTSNPYSSLASSAISLNMKGLIRVQDKKDLELEGAEIYGVFTEKDNEISVSAQEVKKKIEAALEKVQDRKSGIEYIQARGREILADPSNDEIFRETNKLICKRKLSIYGNIEFEYKNGALTRKVSRGGRYGNLRVEDINGNDSTVRTYDHEGNLVSYINKHDDGSESHDRYIFCDFWDATNKKIQKVLSKYEHTKKCRQRYF